MNGTYSNGFIVLSLLAAYFLPWIVAIARNHHQRSAIALLNLLLGWTGLGWIAAIIWLATATPVKEDHYA